MDKIFGGPIVPTLFKLALLSFIVGLVLFLLGIDPVDLWRNFGQTIRDAWVIVIDGLDWASRYAVLGAIVVLPIWIIYRLVMFVSRTKSDK
jgi:hypothetical protein